MTYRIDAIKEYIDQEGFDYFFREYAKVSDFPTKLRSAVAAYRSVADMLESMVEDLASED